MPTETRLMKMMRSAGIVIALLLSFAAAAHAQTTLRIGLAEDPAVREFLLKKRG